MDQNNQVNASVAKQTSLAQKQSREEWLSEYERTRLELERSFERDKYNYIRKELFAHRTDAACTVRPDSITFNQACINGLEDAVFVRLSLNEELRRLLVEPCDEDAPHALRWCVLSGSKRKSRTMTGKDFATLIYTKMNWDKSIRYKMLGFRIAIENGTFAYLFKLDLPERFDILPPASRKKKKPALTPVEEQPVEKQESTSPKASSQGYYGSDLMKDYGISYEQYQQDIAVVEKGGFVQLGMLTGGQEVSHG